MSTIAGGTYTSTPEERETLRLDLQRERLRSVRLATLLREIKHMLIQSLTREPEFRLSHSEIRDLITKIEEVDQ